jgi:hypothetical protein
LEGSELRYQYLTAKGAVGIPVTLLLSALIAAIVGIAILYSDLQNSQNIAIGLGCGSALLSGLALFSLYNTISAVEYGALRPERTVEFDVGFSKVGQRRPYEKTRELKIGEEALLGIHARTYEYDIENYFLEIRLPPELVTTEAIEDKDIMRAR